MAWKKLKFDDDTQARKAVLTPAGAIVPSATTGGFLSAEQDIVDGTGHSHYVLNFDAASKEYAFWEFIIPGDYDGGTIEPTIFWTSTATSGSVKWGVEILGKEPSELWNATLSAGGTKTTDATGAGNIIDSPLTGFSPGWAAGDLVVVGVYRDATDATDDYTADASLVMMEIDYTGR